MLIEVPTLYTSSTSIKPESFNRYKHAFTQAGFMHHVRKIVITFSYIEACYMPKIMYLCHRIPIRNIYETHAEAIHRGLPGPSTAHDRNGYK